MSLLTLCAQPTLPHRCSLDPGSARVSEALRPSVPHYAIPSDRAAVAVATAVAAVARFYF